MFSHHNLASNFTSQGLAASVHYTSRSPNTASYALALLRLTIRGQEDIGTDAYHLEGNLSKRPRCCPILEKGFGLDSGSSPT